MSKSFKLNIPEKKLILVLGDFLIVSLMLYFFSYQVIDIDETTIYYRNIIFGIGIFYFFSLAYVLNFYYLAAESKYTINILTKGLVVTSFFVILHVITGIFLFNVGYWRLNLVIFVTLTPTFILIWRRIFLLLFKFISVPKKVLYIHNNKLLENKDFYVNVINGNQINTFYQVVSTINLDEFRSEDKDKFINICNDVEGWVLDIDTNNKLPEFVEKLMLQSIVEGKEIVTFTSFYENIYEALPIISHNANESCTEILQVQHTRVRYLSRLFSFFVNLCLMLFVGVLFISVTPFVYILNLFFNKGPLFYIQKRIGQFGKEYNIYKFRSMVTDAESSGAKMATKNDARVTAFGKILRMFRIDELPQIISVINGDMLFIGPRPERKIFVDELNKRLPYYNIRHLIKPGITGWAQVKYKYGENLQDSIKKLEFDLYYIKNRSIILDLRIIFKTITTVLFSRGV
ncbi:sugar transferase [Maribacter sp. CXY002]|uniref:sugar transferase n=1 Tax=Maribacter luteocoastalis TaxID=3407671 RepID=UPI003B66E868